FEPCAIERHVLRNAINHHIVAARLALDHPVDLDELRDAVASARFLIHSLDKRRRKTVFLTKEDSDFFHEKRKPRITRIYTDSSKRESLKSFWMPIRIFQAAFAFVFE